MIMAHVHTWTRVSVRGNGPFRHMRRCCSHARDRSFLLKAGAGAVAVDDRRTSDCVVVGFAFRRRRLSSGEIRGSFGGVHVHESNLDGPREPPVSLALVNAASQMRPSLLIYQPPKAALACT